MIGKEGELLDWACGIKKSEHKMGLKGGRSKVSRSRMKLWVIRGTTSVLLWFCAVQLFTLRNMLGARVLKGLPSCFIQDEPAAVIEEKLSSTPARVVPPKSKFLNHQSTLSLLVVCLHRVEFE